MSMNPYIVGISGTVPLLPLGSFAQVSTTGLQSAFVLTEFGGNIYTCGINNSFQAAIKMYNGSSWDQALPGGTHCMDLKVHDGKMYAGTRSPGLVFEGTSIGGSWTSVGAPVGGDHVWTLADHLGVLYAGSLVSGTIAKWDGGTSWTSVGTPVGGNYSIIASDGTNLFATLESTTAVFVYSGSGTTWNSVGNAGGSIKSLTADNGNLYASVSGTAQTVAGIWRYDGGTTWTHIGYPGATDTNLWSNPCSYAGRLFAAQTGVPRVYQDLGSLECALAEDINAIASSIYVGELREFSGELWLSLEGFAGSEGQVYKASI